MPSEIYFILLMIIFSAFFSGVETAILGVNPMNIGQGNARKLSFLNSKKSEMIAACLIGNNLSIVAATLALGSFLGHQKNLKLQIIAFSIQIFLFFFLAEVLPKAIFRKMDIWILGKLYYVILIFYYLFLPLSKFFLWIISFLTERSQEKEEKHDLFFFISSHVLPARKIPIDDIITLSHTKASEVMTPLVDFFSMNENKTIKDAIPLIADTGYSRYPLYSDRGDNISGYVNVFDFLTHGSSEKLHSIAHPAVFIPDTLTIDILLSRMQKSGNPMIFVVNEYESVIGLVTIEDIAEQVVGEIHSIEQRHDTPDIISAGKNKFILDATLDVDDFNENFKTTIKKGGFETLGGYLMAITGNIPKSGEVVNTPEGIFTILSAEKKGIRTVSFKKKKL